MQSQRVRGFVARLLVALVVVAAALVSLIAAPSRIVYAATFSVTSRLDGVDAAPGNSVCATAAGLCTLRAAVQEANAAPGADTISLPAGIYTLTIVGQGEQAAATGDLDLSGQITLTGAGAKTTIIQAGTAPGTGVDRVLDVRPGAVAVISGVTLRYGTTTGGVFGIANGAALWNQGTATLRDAFLTENQASATGGAIYNFGGSLTVERSTISGNTTLGDSGAIQSDHIGGTTVLTIINSTIANNSAGANGAILLAVNGGGGSHTITIFNSTFANNSAPGGAGAIGNAGGVNTVAVQNSILTGNSGGECNGVAWNSGSGNRIDDASCGGAAGNLVALTVVNTSVLE